MYKLYGRYCLGLLSEELSSRGFPSALLSSCVLINYWGLLANAGLQCLWFHTGHFLCFVFLCVLHLSVMSEHECACVWEFPCLRVWMCDWGVTVEGVDFHWWTLEYIQASVWEGNIHTMSQRSIWWKGTGEGKETSGFGSKRRITFQACTLHWAFQQM